MTTGVGDSELESPPLWSEELDELKLELGSATFFSWWKARGYC